MIRKSITFTAGDDFKKLSTFLKKNDISTRIINEIKRSDGLILNGRPAYTIDSVKKGDSVTVIFLEEQRISCDPEDIPIKIIYEDSDLLVVDKPNGIATHPASGTGGGTLANAVTNYFINCGYRIPFRPVSRLDKETSGVIVLVKNKYSHLVLSKQMMSGQYKKVYIARASGLIYEDGEINRPIGRESEESLKRVCREDGKPARTIYKVLKTQKDSTLLELLLKTGRTHQIRVHLESIGHPIIGDPVYGNVSWERMLLHAACVEFLHPVTGEKLKFESILDF